MKTTLVLELDSRTTPLLLFTVVVLVYLEESVTAVIGETTL